LFRAEHQQCCREQAANVATEGLRATVGELRIEPNVVNAVPREARFTVELRSPNDRVRSAAGEAIHAFTHHLAGQQGLTAQIERTYAQSAQPCSDELTDILSRAIRQSGHHAIHLPSGATHDASAMAALCPIAMLFVRCRGGISHKPEESVLPGDLGQAVQVLAHFLTNRTKAKLLNN